MENVPENQSQPLKSEVAPPYISVEEARKRVTYWLETVGEIPLFKEQPAKIPRAIFISHDDLAQLKQDYPDTKGIRVYFGLHAENDDQITGLVVPVLETANGYQDLVRTEDGEEGKSIYDFTRPCPVFCDLTSELYVKLDGAGS